MLEAASHEEAVGSLMTLKWAWDKRKTKQDREERSLQEVGQRVFTALQNALCGKMDDRGWKHATTEFGEAVKPLCEMLDALETDANVKNYPRVMYEAGRQKEEATGHLEEEQEQPTMGQQMNGGGEGTSRRGRGKDARVARRDHGRQTTEEGTQDEDEGEDDRRYPESPKPRRANLDARGYGGWDAVYNMTVDQCARMPTGMQQWSLFRTPYMTNGRGHGTQYTE